MPRYRLTLEYDGTPFCGWQAQDNGESVQQSLEEACFAYCGESPRIMGAGRTDSGVHALGQVAHFDLSAAKESDEIKAALNFHLQKKEVPIAVLDVTATSDDFHARFSATKRHYLYVIENRKAPSVLWRGRAWGVAQPLDKTLMSEVANVFIGQHDWTTFRAAACQAASPVKTLDTLTVEEKGEQILIWARARSFLHHQVRSLVGALVEAGRKKLPPEQARAILEARDRSLCPSLAPACGLYLARIDYDEQ